MSPLITTRAGASANAYGWGAASAAGTAYESIATASGTGSSHIITFSSIPSTYTHLQLRYISNSTLYSGWDVTFNSNTGSNYTNHQLNGTGAAVSASGEASQTGYHNPHYSGYATNTYSAGIMDVLDYASTSKYKTVREFFGYDDNSVGNIIVGSGLWLSTSAISSITITGTNATRYFTTASKFALYGIKAAA